MDKQNRLIAVYEYLRHNGLVHTQKELADAAGAAPSNVSAALKGKPQCLTDSLMRRINAAFGYLFSEKWLITGEGEMLADASELGGQTVSGISIRDRVLNVGKEKGLNPRSLEKLLNIYPGYFSNNVAVSAEVVGKLASLFPDVSADWLLTGKGEMLRSEQSDQPSAWDSFISLVTDEVRRKMNE